MKTKFVNTKILLSKYTIEKVNHYFNLGTCHDKTEELEEQKIFTKIIKLLDEPPYENVSIKGKVLRLLFRSSSFIMTRKRVKFGLLLLMRLVW